MSEVENNTAETTAVDNTNLRPQAESIVKRYMAWGVGAGIVPVPGLDLIAIGTVHTMMLKELYGHYGVSFSEKKARSIVSVLVGTLSPGMLAGMTARSLAKFIPVVGQALSLAASPITTSAITYGIGKLMINHLEAGGTMDNFNPEQAKEELEQNVEEGKEVAQQAQAEEKEQAEKAAAKPATASRKSNAKSGKASKTEPAAAV